MNYVTVIAILIIANCTGALLWLRHEEKIRFNKVHKPWRRAIKEDNWAGCDYYEAVSKNYPLLHLQVVFNPVAWIRYWNWTPPNPQVVKSTIEVEE